MNWQCEASDQEVAGRSRPDVPLIDRAGSIRSHACAAIGACVRESKSSLRSTSHLVRHADSVHASRPVAASIASSSVGTRLERDRERVHGSRETTNAVYSRRATASVPPRNPRSHSSRSSTGRGYVAVHARCRARDLSRPASIHDRATRAPASRCIVPDAPRRLVLGNIGLDDGPRTDDATAAETDPWKDHHIGRDPRVAADLDCASLDPPRHDGPAREQGGALADRRARPIETASLPANHTRSPTIAASPISRRHGASSRAVLRQRTPRPTRRKESQQALRVR